MDRVSCSIAGILPKKVCTSYITRLGIPAFLQTLHLKQHVRFFIRRWCKRVGFFGEIFPSVLAFDVGACEPTTVYTSFDFVDPFVINETALIFWKNPVSTLGLRSLSPPRLPFVPPLPFQFPLGQVVYPTNQALMRSAVPNRHCVQNLGFEQGLLKWFRCVALWWMTVPFFLPLHHVELVPGFLTLQSAGLWTENPFLHANARFGKGTATADELAGSALNGISPGDAGGVVAKGSVLSGGVIP